MGDAQSHLAFHNKNEVFSETDPHDCCGFCYHVVHATLDSNCQMLAADEDKAKELLLAYFEKHQGKASADVLLPHLRSVRNNKFDWCSHQDCAMTRRE
jgi:hypothetical protein